jgi:hypothetical protein
MKRPNRIVLIALIFSFPEILYAEEQGLNNPIHKFWSCAITTYNSLVNGKVQEDRCRANTQYSEPPCQAFFIEYEGVDGIRPGVPFTQTVEHKRLKSASTSDNEPAPPPELTTTTIEIRKDNDQYFYTQSIVKTGVKLTNKWLYSGKCSYYTAPVNEKIYMERGLPTAR